MSFEDELQNELEFYHNIITQDGDNLDTIEYNPDLAMVMAQMIVDINNSVTRKGSAFAEVFAQQYMLGKGLKLFGERGTNAAINEVDQLHRRTCFTPQLVSEMTAEEKRKAQAALMFLTEKRNGEVKGRMVFNGKPTRE